jgi:hypothetical protein
MVYIAAFVAWIDCKRLQVVAGGLPENLGPVDQDQRPPPEAKLPPGPELAYLEPCLEDESLWGVFEPTELVEILERSQSDV